MKFYLLDDDRTITNILKIIIQKRNLGEVCGTSTHAVEALEDIRILKPDIIITDLLMPEMDGITFVKKAKEILPDAACIMPVSYTHLQDIKSQSGLSSHP